MARIRQKTLKRLILPAGMFAGFFVFLFATDPNKLPVGWLLLPFMLLYGALFSTFLYIQGRRRAQTSGVSARSYVTAGILAAIPTFLLLLDSINQLTLGDALIFIVFAVIALFYVRRLSFARRT